jgi:hypothetical protein
MLERPILQVKNRMKKNFSATDEGDHAMSSWSLSRECMFQCVHFISLFFMSIRTMYIIIACSKTSENTWFCYACRLPVIISGPGGI